MSKPKHERVTITLPPEIKARIDELASEMDMSRSEWIAYAAARVPGDAMLTPSQWQAIRQLANDLKPFADD